MITRRWSFTLGAARRQVTWFAVVLATAVALVGTIPIASAAAAGGNGAWLPHRLGFPLALGAIPTPFDGMLARVGSGARPIAGAPGFSGPAPTVAVGGNPVGVAVDPATHTVYVANGTSNTVSVINAATCNATNTPGCNQTPPTVAVGSGPLAVALDRQTGTLYVTNNDGGTGNTVSMINVATCNATDTAGCNQTPPTVVVGSGPALLAVDQATSTIYVPNSSGNTVSVIDGATCNAGDTSGCGDVSTLTVGSGPNAVALNEDDHTAYVANFTDGTVSVVDTATCNASDTSDCAQLPPAVPVGSLPSTLVVDQASDTAYVQVGPAGNASLGSIAMINGATCNATVTAGCSNTPRTTPVGSNPEWVTENATTHTVYVVNQEDSDVSVIDASTCNAIDSAGCRETPPAMAIGFNGGGIAVDSSTDTVYATSQNNNTVSVLNGATCDATNTRGCTQFASTTPVGAAPQPIAVDETTDTVYVGNTSDNTVSVVNAAACNAAHPAGCDRVWPTIDVGSSPFFGLALDRRTDTLYVTNVVDKTVSVINTATCNAHVSWGCGQSPPTVATGNAPLPVALDQATNTLYVANQGDDTVSVINAATCNAQNPSGCNQTPPAINVNDSPYGLAVDEHTDTVYVANTGNEIFNTGYANLVSSVSVINGAACNATHHAGCSNTPTSVPVGGFPWDVAVDPTTDAVYVTSIVDSDIAVINGAACNGRQTSDCRPRLIPVRTGGWPADIGLDPAARTMYVTDNVDGNMSLFSLRR
jgi:YVTN family beta-propeller protein